MGFFAGDRPLNPDVQRPLLLLARDRNGSKAAIRRGALHAQPSPLEKEDKWQALRPPTGALPCLAGHLASQRSCSLTVFSVKPRAGPEKVREADAQASGGQRVVDREL